MYSWLSMKSQIAHLGKMPLRRSQRSSVVKEFSKPDRILGSLENCQSFLENDVTTKALMDLNEKVCSGVTSPKKDVSCAPKRLKDSTSEKDDFTSAFASQRNLKTDNEKMPLICRHQEIAIIKDIVEKCIREKQNSSVYVSGAPGTGKTAVVRNICSSMKHCRTVYVNCMRVTDSLTLSQAIIQQLCYGNEEADHVQTMRCVEDYLSNHFTSRPIVLILDEMDSLVEKHQEVLYRLFDWPHTLTCRLVILCIANSLDLTDRLLPRLKARAWRPVLLHFKPYNHEQLTEIACARLSYDKDNDFPIETSALQLCARKVAASSGDARAMLDICRRCIDLAGTSPANLSHVSHAFKGAHSTPTPSSNSSPLPLQQKLALAAAFLMVRREFTLGALLDRYSGLCREHQLIPLDAGEFSGVCQLLEARGMLGIKKAKEARLHRLSIKLDDRSVKRAIDDQSLIASVLANGEKTI